MQKKVYTMNIPLFFGLVGLLGIIYIWIGKSAAGNQQSNDDYFLMGRKLTFFPLSLTLLATQLGGGTLLGAAQEAYMKGWFVLLYPLGTCLGFIVLGLGFGAKLRKLNISTIAEIFEKVYRSRQQRHFASGLSILALFFILAGQGIATRLFFMTMGVESPVVFMIFWSILVAYTVMGGLQAVVKTDILQTLFIMVTLICAFFMIDPTVVAASTQGSVVDSVKVSELPLSAWLLMPLLFMLIEQDMGQRCFAAKNSKVISCAAIAAAGVLFCCSIIGIYFGVLARNLGIEVMENASVLVESVRALTNPTVTTFFMVAIFLAVISTADSLLCSISSNLSYDFLVSEEMSEIKRVKIGRLLTLMTGLASMGVAFFFDNVISLLLLSYELSVCLLFVPIVMAILTRFPSKRGSALSMVFGAAGFVVFRYIECPVPKEIMTVSLSFFGYYLGKQVYTRCASKFGVLG